MDKKWIKYVFFTIIIVAIIIALIAFYYNKITNKTVSLADKIDAELKYLDTATIYMINEINNLNDVQSVTVQKTSTESANSEEQNNQNESSNSQSSEEKYSIQNNSIMLRDTSSIDWANLETMAENLYSAWLTVEIDLASANVSSKNILAYNENLDNLLTSIKNKDKTNSEICLANLCNLVIAYMEETSSNTEKLNIEKIKSNIVSAYALVETGNWDDVSKMLATAENNMTDLINSYVSPDESKQTKINKCYVLLKELIKSCNEKDLDTFYLKYAVLINEHMVDF